MVAFGAALAGVVLSLGALSSVLAAAAYVLYEDIQAGNISDYQTARSSGTLKGELICAIRGAIAADGAVTAGNFAAVLTAISGIAYLPTAVVTTIHDYVATLGATGIMQVQAVGAVAVYDCTACTGGWCFTWDFTSGSVGTWVIATGSEVSGQGVESVPSSFAEGGTSLVIYNLFTSTFIVSVQVSWSATVACETTRPASHFRDLSSYPAGTNHDMYMGVTGPRTDLITVNENCTELQLQLSTILVGGSAVAGLNTCTRITVRGTGANPFGASNCT